MANTSITFTWYDESKDSTDSYVHEMTSADMDRIIEAGRNIFAEINPDTGVYAPVSKNKARKTMCKESLRIWKERAREDEIKIAEQNASANIPPIDSTEI